MATKERKTFSKAKANISNKLKNAFVVATAMLALGNPQEVKADTVLDKIFNTIERIDDKIRDINRDISYKKSQVNSLKYNVNRLTGTAGAGISVVKKLVQANKEKQAQQMVSQTTYQTTPQDYQQPVSDNNASYLNSVRSKLENKSNTNPQSSVTTKNTQKTTVKANKTSNYSSDVQNVLSILEANGGRK